MKAVFPVVAMSKLFNCSDEGKLQQFVYFTVAGDLLPAVYFLSPQMQMLLAIMRPHQITNHNTQNSCCVCFLYTPQIQFEMCTVTI